MNIFEALENLSLIKPIPISDGVYEAIEEKEGRIICLIEMQKKEYTATIRTGFEDVYRILEYFNFKDSDNTERDNAKCDGLSCEDCSGCAYNTLTSLYNCRKRLEKYLDKNMLENYTFIGGLSIEDRLIAKSPYRRYISYIDGGFIVTSPSSGLNPENNFIYPNSDILIDNLFIEQYIPEVLKISGDIKRVYGMYKNKAVLWQLKSLNSRDIWTYSILNS